MMRFASLGSGSEGNGLLVEADGTCILVDCGFALNETIERLSRCGIDPASVAGLLITHEHSDHIGGAARFARKFGMPVWLTHGTLQAAGDRFAGMTSIHVFDCHARFAVDAIEINPYTVPHDAREPAQFVFSDGSARLGLLTDAGSITAHMLEMLNGLDALVLECNHDLELLRKSSYPERLKQRIAGKFGHLDNATAAQLIAGIDCGRLKHVIAAHLSQQNNTPELARAALATALGCEVGWISVATQHDGFDWRQVG